MTMNERGACHRTVIVRCWTEEDETAEQHFWRFHLHWLDTDQKESFADVAGLLAFLNGVFGEEEVGSG
jgi:hypothetical protein